LRREHDREQLVQRSFRAAGERRAAGQHRPHPRALRRSAETGHAAAVAGDRCDRTIRADDIARVLHAAAAEVVDLVGVRRPPDRRAGARLLHQLPAGVVVSRLQRGRGGGLHRRLQNADEVAVGIEGVVVARGGVYSEGPMQRFNFQDTYLRAALTFMGVNDIELIAIEGVAFGPEAADRAVGAALAKVSAIAA